MVELTDDYQFELEGVLFGRSQPIFVEDTGFSPGSVDWRTQDTELPQGDGMMVGRDFIGPMTWAWSLGVDTTTPEEAVVQAELLAGVWLGNAARRSPGAVLPLRYRVAGRTRRVYGRPRRFAPSYDNRFLSGYQAITADFRCVDHLHYDDDLQQATLAVGEISQVGGFSEPITEPMSETRTITAARLGSVVVGGSAPTWIEVTFDGPITNPWLDVDNGLWRVELTTTLSDGESVTIDPRPWARTALRNDGASVAGTLTRQSRLSAMSLEPGPHQLTFGGSATEAGSSATVSWRDASYSL